MLGRRGGIHLLFADQIGAEQAGWSRRPPASCSTTARTLKSSSSPRRADPAELPGFEARPGARSRGAHARRRAARGCCSTMARRVQRRRPRIRDPPASRRDTPAPWSNVLANEAFGTVVTEAGGGFSWAGNSGENRLTPWTNDPVADRRARRSIFVTRRQRRSGRPRRGRPGATPPARSATARATREWQRRAHGLEQELLVFVPVDDPVKLVRLRCATCGSGTAGSPRPTMRNGCSAPCEHVAPARRLRAATSPACGRSWRRNPWNVRLRRRVAFLAARAGAARPDHRPAEFLGREGDPARPAGLARWGSERPGRARRRSVRRLSGASRRSPGGSDEVVFVLGQGRDRAQAEALVRRWSDPDQVEAASKSSKLLGREARRGRSEAPRSGLRPDDQPLAALPEPGLAAPGAGRLLPGRRRVRLRDQLQDVLALLHAEPAAGARAYPRKRRPPVRGGRRAALVASALRSGRAHALLGRPAVAALRGRPYVQATGDVSILDERCPSSKAPRWTGRGGSLRPLRGLSEPRSLFDHLRAGARARRHQGRPRPAADRSGDWNDGMDRIGAAGRGESVWLGWFRSP
jgi:cyclic beta-1,2-glucan synthetase